MAFNEGSSSGVSSSLGVHDLILQTRNLYCEEDAVELEEVGEEKGRSVKVVGKIVSERAYRPDLVKTVMKNVWRLKNDFQVSRLKFNLFAFNFENQQDGMKVLNGVPWLINNSLLNMKEWNRSVPLEEVVCNRSPFCVRIHGMAPALMSPTNTMRMGNKFGGLAEYDEKVEEGGTWSRYFRLKVWVDISRALHFEIVRRKEDEVVDKYLVQYEKLPDFCYHCGKIGHVERICETKEEDRGRGKEAREDLSYGAWMRAENPLPPMQGRAREKALVENKPTDGGARPKK